MADAWNAGQPEQVITLATQSDAENENVLLLLGLAQQATQRLPQAAATFLRLTQIQPGVSAYWNNLAVTCRQAGDLAGAEQALLTAQSLAPNDAELHYNLGLLYTQQQHWPLARQALLDAVQLSPNFIEARLQAAYACYVCGDSSSQEAMLSGAIHWPAHPAEQALILASMLAVQGDLEAALHTLAQAQLPDEPAAAALRLRIAAQRTLLYERNNLVDAAQQELRTLSPDALDALPKDAQQARADGWRAHAALAMRTGAYADATILYRRVLALTTDDESQAGASFGLASASDRLGHHQEAWRALQDAHTAQLNIAR
ncbi:MAG: tetratricopeptide repeat protein, partial [Rhodanobacter sp.]